MWTDLRDGLLFVVTTRWLFWTLVVTAVSAFSVTGPAEVLLPYLTQEKFVDHGPLVFGPLLAAVGIGAAVGAITVSSRGLPRRYLTVLNLGTAAGMLTLIALGNASAFAVMAAAAMVIGLVQGMALVIRATLLQRRGHARNSGVSPVWMSFDLGPRACVHRRHRRPIGSGVP